MYVENIRQFLSTNSFFSNYPFDIYTYTHNIRDIHSLGHKEKNPLYTPTLTHTHLCTLFKKVGTI